MFLSKWTYDILPHYSEISEISTCNHAEILYSPNDYPAGWVVILRQRKASFIFAKFFFWGLYFYVK